MLPAAVDVVDDCGDMGGERGRFEKLGGRRGDVGLVGVL